MTARGKTSPALSRPGFGWSAVLFPALALLFILLPAGCQEPPPEDILFRYRFRPGEVLLYRVTFQGGGEVTMTMGEEKGEKENISLPVRLEGGYLMEIEVEEVSPGEEARLSLRYRDFNLTSISRVREREMTALLTDRGMVISEGDRVIKEIRPGEANYPLQGIVGEKFGFQVDSRGTILEARMPPAPERLFPSLQFEAFLERMQPEFPREPVPVGSSWTREVSVPGPGLGRTWDQGQRWTVEIVSTFSGFAGRGDRVARIDFSGDFQQEAPAAEPAGRSGPRGSSHSLQGSYEFDRAAGRVLSSRSTLRQKLDLRIAFDEVLRGREIDIRVDDTMEVVIQLQQ